MGEMTYDEAKEIVLTESMNMGDSLHHAVLMRLSIARLEAERDALAREKRALANGAFSEMARVEKERDHLGASAARMREALEGAGCDVYAGALGEAPICQVHDLELDGRCVIQTALADPAPLEWLRQHDAEVVEPYREALETLGHWFNAHITCDDDCPCEVFEVMEVHSAGRAGTEAPDA